MWFLTLEISQDLLSNQYKSGFFSMNFFDVNQNLHDTSIELF